MPPILRSFKLVGQSKQSNSQDNFMLFEQKLSPNMTETSIREGRDPNPAIRNMNVEENKLMVAGWFFMLLVGLGPSFSLLRILS